MYGCMEFLDSYISTTKTDRTAKFYTQCQVQMKFLGFKEDIEKSKKIKAKRSTKKKVSQKLL